MPPRRRAPEPLTTAVATGERRRSLEALRAVLAARLEGAERDADVATLSKQLREVMAELESLPTPKGGSIFDDLAGRREARSRRSESARSKRPAVK